MGQQAQTFRSKKQKVKEFFPRLKCGDDEEASLEFVQKFVDAREHPHTMCEVETCASLYVFTNLLVESYADTASKIIRYNLVDKLHKQFDSKARSRYQTNLERLFPVNEHVQRR